MEIMLTELRDRVQRHASALVVETAAPRFYLGRNCNRTASSPMLYQPMVCFVVQGAKHVAIGDRRLRYDASSYFLASLDLPVSSCVIEATSQRPFLAAALSIDPAKVAALTPDASSTVPEPDGPAFGVSPMSPDMLEVWLRMVRLLDTPDDIPTLAPLVERELLYRVLRGPQGQALRQFGRADSRLSRVRRAIAEIRESYDKTLRVEALAEVAGMSVASFHRHFKAATAMSPLQYQKRLRLQQARALLLANEEAARAAYAVGYESASQFSREYARLFGAPPARDMARVRASSQMTT